MATGPALSGIMIDRPLVDGSRRRRSMHCRRLESVVAAAGEAPVCFYRTAAGAEVDLVIEGRRNRRYAIEIKRSSAPTVSKGFWNGRDDVGAREALVIYPGDERIPIGDRAEALGLHDAITWVRDRVHGHG